jgi:PEP-CTERM motif
MRSFTARLGTALALSVSFAAPAAWANVMWTQEFCVTDCSGVTPTSSPITKIDFIMSTPGVTFSSIGPVYTNSGETTLDTNAVTTLGTEESLIDFNPADLSDVAFNLGFSSPSTSTPFTFYWEQWDGSQFITTNSSVTSSDIVSWNGSAWSFTPMTAPVPEPGTLALFGLGIVALFFVRRRSAG